MSSNSNEAADAQYNKMINTPVRNLIFTLSVPTVISMLITMIYNMADTYFVSKISVSASGATGIVFGLMAIFQAFGFMFGQGSGSNIARRLGAKDLDGANQFCSTAFVVSLLTSVVISVICISFLDRLMRLLGSTDTILPYAKAYGIYIIIAGPAMTVGCVLNNILRYEGLAKLAMIGLTSGGILNILLDPLFIFTFKMGISGAGLATALSQYISVIILFMMFVLKKSQCCIKFKYVRMQFRFVWEIVATGFPSFIRNGLSSISTMVLNVMSSPYGDECIAAMSVANR
ncbi:MAG: MATE family efflux transporter, partial [Clostridiales bacterium]|nr:MATE family efflux transporter [Clostridiales bacterium]